MNSSPISTREATTTVSRNLRESARSFRETSCLFRFAM